MISDIVCEIETIQKINQGDESAFEQLFHLYYDRLCMFSAGYVGSSDQARDVVQEVFIALWENRQTRTIETALKSYLFQAVRNRSSNALIQAYRNRTVGESLQFHADQKRDQILKVLGFEETPVLRDERRAAPGLEKIWLHGSQRPEKRKAVFTLHRKHGLSYQEIAMVMGITRKTVENQMGRALKYLRSVLSADQFV